MDLLLKSALGKSSAARLVAAGARKTLKNSPLAAAGSSSPRFASSALPAWQSAAAAQNCGIVGWDVYTPRTYVSQEALETFDGVSAGKYTKGLGQTAMAFVDAREDIVSMMLTATQNLLEKSGVSPSEIGRLEVGTETLVDKSKATKTSLMRLFGAETDIEGVDTINACYGGTNALFNCLHWMGSPSWDGRYAIVVTGDIAVYERGPARPTGGAGVVAMLIGPDAPVEINVAAPRATHMEDAYDFYKPDLQSEYPAVDGHLSNTCYLRAVDRCFARMASKWSSHGTQFDVRHFQNAIFHQPYQKLVKKSYARYLWNQHKLTGDVSPELDQFLSLTDEETYASRDLDKAATAAVGAAYDEKVYPSTLLGRENGNMYTGSLYAGLASLVGQKGNQLDGERALLFSYGSGLAATMFATEFRADAAGVRTTLGGDDGLDGLSRMLQLDSLLGNREEVSPEEYTQALEKRRETYGTFPLNVEPTARSGRPGTFYLKQVDELGRRSYERHMSTVRQAGTQQSPLPQLSMPWADRRDRSTATSLVAEDADGWACPDLPSPSGGGSGMGHHTLATLSASIMPSQLHGSRKFRDEQSSQGSHTFNTPVFPVP